MCNANFIVFEKNSVVFRGGAAAAVDESHHIGFTHGVPADVRVEDEIIVNDLIECFGVCGVPCFVVCFND